MAEFVVSKKLLGELIKSGCVKKTLKSKGLIDALEFSIEENQIVVKGIDNGGTVMSCVRARLEQENVRETGKFVYAPKELCDKLQMFGEEVVVRTDEIRIYVTDSTGDTAFSDTLPAIGLDFPLEMRVLEDKILPEEKVELTHKTVVRAAPPKLGKDVTLYFGQKGFSIGHEDELTKFQKKLGAETFEEELRIKLDGNFFDKVISVLGDEFILGANKDMVFLYTREDWGDMAYLMSTL